MTFNPKLNVGRLTVGETRALVASITGADSPSDVESFAVISLNHVTRFHHDLVVISNEKDPRQIDAILYLAHRSTVAKIPQTARPNYIRFGWLWSALIRIGRFASLWKYT